MGGKDRASGEYFLAILSLCKENPPFFSIVEEFLPYAIPKGGGDILYKGRWRTGRWWWDTCLLCQSGCRKKKRERVWYSRKMDGQTVALISISRLEMGEGHIEAHPEVRWRKK